MKVFTQIIPSFLVLSLMFACEPEVVGPNPSNSPSTIEILPLGDSRVEGFRPVHESYRYDLWKNLVENDWDIDFIGSRKDEGTYPEVNGRSFDPDHQSLGGEMTTGLLETLNDIEFQQVPDVALLGIGGNDLTDGDMNAVSTVDRIRQIIEKLQNINPEITIFVEQIAPATTEFMTPERTVLFNAFNQELSEMIPSVQGDRSKVVLINMAEGWSDDYMADPLHYNETGAKVVADRYFAAMEKEISR
ncbi:MAG: GDSL-type esterase/lipase family protein [Bacteroidota bacterium]